MQQIDTGEKQKAQFHDFLQRKELQMPQCSRCSFVRQPGAWLCPECQSTDWTWARLSGKGTVESFTWYMQPVNPAFTEVPYNVVLIHLIEGPRIISRVIHCDFGELAVDQSVYAHFGVLNEMPILYFRLG